MHVCVCESKKQPWLEHLKKKKTRQKTNTPKHDSSCTTSSSGIDFRQMKAELNGSRLKLGSPSELLKMSGIVCIRVSLGERDTAEAVFRLSRKPGACRDLIVIFELFGRRSPAFLSSICTLHPVDVEFL